MDTEESCEAANMIQQEAQGRGRKVTSGGGEGGGRAGGSLAEDNSRYNRAPPPSLSSDQTVAA